MRGRLILTAALLCLFSIVVLGKLVDLQIFEHGCWLEKAKSFQERQIIKAQRRGNIFDRNGLPLAYDLKTSSIALDNYHMTKPEVLEAILAEKLGLPRSYLEERIYRESYFTWIKRKVNLEIAEEIKKAAKEEGIQGLIFIEEWKRVYPQGSLASNVIGFAGLDNRGLEGIELALDEPLIGKEEIIEVVFDAKGRRVLKKVLQRGSPGKDIFLTIDAKIQYLAERKISEGVSRYKAKGGFAIVMDPKTGEVLAMAQTNRYDLNEFQRASPAQKLNLAVTYPFEPGSAFKIFAGLAALEYKVVGIHEKFNGNEPVIVGGHPFHNAEGRDFGPVTLTEIIKNSINTGMIRVASRLGEERLYTFLKRLGFGEKTGIEFPGEVTGTLMPLDDWSRLEIASIPIGQAVSVTGIQLISRAAAIANDGILMRPQIIKEVRDSSKSKKSKPEPLKRIASPENIQIMQRMMREVVKSGTGIPASIDGFEVAAKTGTAQKALPGEGYVKGKYTSLFVGFFPIEDPQFIILVVLDEVGVEPPWGGYTAGPIFKEIAEGIINLRKLHPASLKEG